MKRILLLILITTFSVNSNTIYKQYLFDNQTKAKNIIKSVFSNDVTIQSVEQGVGGLFNVNVINELGNEETLYVLPDLKNVIRGKLYSPYITEVKDANGSQYLEVLAKQNKQRMEILSNFTNHNVKKANFDSFLTTDKVNHKVQEKKAPFDDGFDEEQYYSDVEKSTYIQFGNSEKYIYAFFDHYCPACRIIDPNLRALAIKYNVGIRYIPVSILGSEESTAKAEMVLYPKDNKMRLEWKELFTKKSLITEVLPSEYVTQEVIGSEQFKNARKARIYNRTLFDRLPILATPSFTFMDDGVAHVISATSENVFEKMFYAVANEQKQTN